MHVNVMEHVFCPKQTEVDDKWINTFFFILVDMGPLHSRFYSPSFHHLHSHAPRNTPFIDAPPPHLHHSLSHLYPPVPTHHYPAHAGVGHMAHHEQHPFGFSEEDLQHMLNWQRIQVVQRQTLPTWLVFPAILMEPNVHFKNMINLHDPYFKNLSSMIFIYIYSKPIHAL